MKEYRWVFEWTYLLYHRVPLNNIIDIYQIILTPSPPPPTVCHLSRFIYSTFRGSKWTSSVKSILTFTILFIRYSIALFYTKDLADITETKRNDGQHLIHKE